MIRCSREGFESGMARENQEDKPEPEVVRNQQGGSKPADGSKAEPGASQQGDAEAGGRAAGQAQVVKNMLTKLEAKMEEDQMKATLGDYIRLVQLHKELDDESPREIRVTWVEP